MKEAIVVSLALVFLFAGGALYESEHPPEYLEILSCVDTDRRTKIVSPYPAPQTYVDRLMLPRSVTCTKLGWRKNPEWHENSSSP